ncbi:MAG: protoglobin domain-containing protein [Thermodesulfobacteriota bacterium]
MENIDEIRKHYGLHAQDDLNLKELAQILLPYADQMADDFYDYLAEDPYSANFFKTSAAVKRRKETIIVWFQNLLAGNYNNSYLAKLRRIGQVHVRIGLKGHFFITAMNFLRTFCIRHTTQADLEEATKNDLLETLNKVIDLNLDVITSSYREAELRKVFLSYRAESVMIQWSERLMHGLNLVLLIGLLVMSLGVVTLLGSDVYHAFSSDLQHGVIKALGSLLILWMMIELLHTQVDVLRGGKFHVRIFLELALVAFIRKLFVASVESKDPISFALLLGGTLALGFILFLLAKSESWEK